MHEARRLAASVVEEPDASDIVHDTLLAVCQKSPENPRNYLLTAIKNRSRTNRGHPLRRPGRSCPIEDAPVQACLHTPELELSNWEAVNRAMCMLAPEERLVITMTSDGWTAEEIAGMVGITAPAVRKRKQRAAAKFRQEYARLCE